jgi:hypothetical protein
MMQQRLRPEVDSPEDHAAIVYDVELRVQCHRRRLLISAANLARCCGDEEDSVRSFIFELSRRTKMWQFELHRLESLVYHGGGESST